MKQFLWIRVLAPSLLLALSVIAVNCLPGLLDGRDSNANQTVQTAPNNQVETVYHSPNRQTGEPEQPLFDLLPASRTGVDFRNTISETDRANILTYSYMYNGGGVAVGDVNNDGLVDLFFTSNQGKNRLYLNLGDMKFRDITDSAGLGNSRGWHSGVNMTDVNQDGWLDIYVCRSGPETTPAERANLLFINNGDLKFTEQAEAYGIADTNHSTQAGFFDYDRDGDLDLYVMNHPVFFGFATVREVQGKVKDPQIARANTDNLYRNNGDGSFSRVTQEVGCQNLGYGLGLVTTDFNGDGWTDIYVANDFSTPDFLYINQGDGTFRDEIKQRTGHISYYGMGIDHFDINNDGHPDLVELDMTAQDRVRSKTLMPSMSPRQFWGLIKVLDHHYQYMFNSLQLNQGNGYFSEIGLLAGVAKTDWSWAVLGADFDHDGFDDMIVTNGFRRDSKDNDFLTRFRKAKSDAGGRQAMMDQGLMMGWVRQIPSQRIGNYLYRNNGDLTFQDVSKKWGFNQDSFSNGAAYADLDNDGDLDLVISNIDDPAFIYQNRVEQEFPDRRFLRVRPIDSSGNIVPNTKVSLSQGEQVQTKELTVCRGYQSSVEGVLHFGVGQAPVIDLVQVHWPDGSVAEYRDIATGQTLSVVAGQSLTRQPRDVLSSRQRYFQAAKQLMPVRHFENEFDEYRNEILLPHSQSSLGPCLAVGDVNHDGLDDMFIGASRGEPAILLLQAKNGAFFPASSQPWQSFRFSENVDSLFLDADNDGDLDLYVGNGGGSDFRADDIHLKDQFYRNDEGTFSYDAQALPDLRVSCGTVEPIDFDQDGDIDLFVGGHNVPGRYPESPRSYLLENQSGRFTTASWPAPLERLGMVHDALATDFDRDGDQDLIVVGEWTAVQFLQNDEGSFRPVRMPGADQLNGWWFSVTELDVNADGRQDYLLGNLGTNNKFRSKDETQLRVRCNDFDDNGTLDIVLSKEYDGLEYPVRGRECSSQQMPFLANKFPTFHDFAMADLTELLEPDKLSGGIQLSVNQFASCLLVATDQGYDVVKLANGAQLSPIRDALPTDLNGDGHVDIVVVGNLYQTEVETTRYDAGMGLVLIGDGIGGFEPVFSGESGLRNMADSRRIARFATRDGFRVIIVNNNDRPVLFDFVR